MKKAQAPETWRPHAVYLAVLAGAVGVVAAVGVFARGDGSTEQVVSAREEPFEMVTTGVYANNPERLVAEGIGWDLVTLLLVVPALLLVARGVARGSLRARLAAIGLLGYVFYQYLMYAMAWAVGPLLPAFIVLYAASLMGIGWLLVTIPIQQLSTHVTGRFPRRAVSAYAAAIAMLLNTPLVARLYGPICQRSAISRLGSSAEQQVEEHRQEDGGKNRNQDHRQAPGATAERPDLDVPEPQLEPPVLCALT